MATVRASCGNCGDVELRSRQVTVRVCREDSSATYTFRCPSCERITVRDAAPRIVELLVASGSPLVTWSLPAELFEAHHGEPITHDDLLDFHRLLETDDWVARLATSGDAGDPGRPRR